MKVLVGEPFNISSSHFQKKRLPKLLYILCLFFVLSSTSCEERQWLEVHEGDVLLEKFQHLGDSIRDGIYESYLEDGSLFERSVYAKGKLHGEKKFYFANGQVQSIETVIDDKYNGPFKLFDSTGQILQECVYENDKTIGTLVNYYSNGQVKEKVEFSNGEENGAFVEYFENGNLKAEGFYKNGDYEHGPLKLYDSTGVLIRKMDCEEGVCRTTWKITTE